jgi:hypothetical protein
MDEPSAESKGKARKISIQVTEQPAPEPIAPVPTQPDAKIIKKKLRNSYIYLAIGVALVIVSSFDLYTQNAKGQAALGLLIVGGLWLLYGTYAYLRARSDF